MLEVIGYALVVVAHRHTDEECIFEAEPLITQILLGAETPRGTRDNQLRSNKGDSSVHLWFTVTSNSQCVIIPATCS